MKNCVILEMENSNDFENAMNDYLDDGYKDTDIKYCDQCGQALDWEN